MESKEVNKASNHMSCWRKWYEEKPEEKSIDAFQRFRESSAEIFFFYAGIPCLLSFAIILNAWPALSGKYVCFIPTLIWIFLRSSRKDMTATAHWVAGLFGGIGGAVSVLLFRKFLP